MWGCDVDISKRKNKITEEKQVKSQQEIELLDRWRGAMCLTADVIDDLVTKDVEREKDNNGMKSCQQNNTFTHNYFFLE